MTPSPKPTTTSSSDTSEDRSEQLPSVEEAKMMEAARRQSESNSISSKPSSLSDIETAFSGSQGYDDDDSFGQVHDQLPSVEDARLHSPRSARNSKRCTIVWMTVLLVVLSVTAATLAVVFTKDVAADDEEFYVGDASSSAAVDGTPSGPTTTSTAAPVDSDAAASSATTTPVTVTTNAPQQWTSRLPAIVQLLSEAGVSTLADLDRAGSPQYQAALWVADQDEAQVAIAKADELVQRYVMTVFYYALDGDQWPDRLSFLSANPVCNWVMNGFAADRKTARKYGVSCGEAGTVTQLHFPSNFLVGTLPSELAFLKDLERFEVFNNPGLVGGFPAFLKDIPKVNYIGLHYCGLTGSLPAWLGEMTSLQSLVLSNNNLSGELPAKLPTGLTDLYLDDNNMGGDIRVLASLTSLKNVVLEDNKFEGSLDEQMVNNWRQMEVLDISHNRIQSTIPGAFFTLPNLRILDLHGNAFRGPLPKPANTNTALEVLTLNENELTGNVPEELSQCVNLKQLDFTGNKFTSTLPPSLGSLSKLEFFYAAQNPFKAAPIPTFLSSLISLKELSLKDTQLVDTIPDWLGSMSTLILLDLDNNRLQGTLPASLSSLTSLEYLLLNRNELEGNIPASFSSLSKLAYFMVEKNKITGSTNAVCGNPDEVRVFAADCKGDNAAVDCPCCTVCCAEGEEGCNDQVWLGDSNPIWELNYERAGPINFDASASLTYTIQFGGDIP